MDQAHAGQQLPVDAVYQKFEEEGHQRPNQPILIGHVRTRGHDTRLLTHGGPNVTGGRDRDVPMKWKLWEAGYGYVGAVQQAAAPSFLTWLTVSFIQMEEFELHGPLENNDPFGVFKIENSWTKAFLQALGILQLLHALDIKRGCYWEFQIGGQVVAFGLSKGDHLRSDNVKTKRVNDATRVSIYQGIGAGHAWSNHVLALAVDLSRELWLERRQQRVKMVWLCLAMTAVALIYCKAADIQWILAGGVGLYFFAVISAFISVGCSCHW